MRDWVSGDAQTVFPEQYILNSVGQYWLLNSIYILNWVSGDAQTCRTSIRFPLAILRAGTVTIAFTLNWFYFDKFLIWDTRGKFHVHLKSQLSARIALNVKDFETYISILMSMTWPSLNSNSGNTINELKNNMFQQNTIFQNNIEQQCWTVLNNIYIEQWKHEKGISVV